MWCVPVPPTIRWVWCSQGYLAPWGTRCDHIYPYLSEAKGQQRIALWASGGLRNKATCGQATSHLGISKNRARLWSSWTHNDSLWWKNVGSFITHRWGNCTISQIPFTKTCGPWQIHCRKVRHSLWNKLIGYFTICPDSSFEARDIWICNNPQATPRSGHTTHFHVHSTHPVSRHQASSLKIPMRNSKNI